MVDIIAGLVWLSVIFAPDGSYTGANLVTDSKSDCERAVAYARTQVPEGFTVLSCTSVPASLSGARLDGGVEAP